MLRFLLQLGFALTVSGFALRFAGIELYALVGGTLAFVGLGLIYATKGFHNNDESVPTPQWFGLTLVICIGCGAIWPSLPVIFAIERTRRRANGSEVAPASTDKRPRL